MQPCVQNIGAKNEFIFYPHGVKYEKKFGSLFAPFSFKNCLNFEHLSLLFKLVYDP